ncbi:MAG: ATP-binding cassette domain-containing protein, partial [Cyanobacteriota bacterium]
MLQKSLVSIRSLNQYFGHGGLRRKVLCNINIEIKPGEIVILSGPSGSGKTTLLTMIGGLRTVEQGSLKVFDQELRGASDAQ